MKRVLILAGPSGSGKSEISLNLALQRKQVEPVALVDLDIIKPLFRLRNLRAHIEPLKLRFITSGKEWDGADLPILPGQLGSWLESNQTVIVDLGGDGAGARVLTQYASSLPVEETEMLFVANPNRPFARDAQESLSALKEIEASTGILFTALVSNPHLKEHTALSTIMDGHALVEELSLLSGLPIAFIAVRDDLAPAVRPRLHRACLSQHVLSSRFFPEMDRSDEKNGESKDLPLLPLQIWIRPPWECAEPRREGGE